MKNPIRTGLLACLLAVATPAFAVQSVDESRDARADGTVEIVVVRGEIEVAGWAKDKVHVKGELDEHLKEFIFEVDGSRTRVHVDLKDMESFSGGKETRLTISVPRGSRVETKGVSTDQKLQEISGDVSVKSVSGDLELEKVTAGVNIKGVSGDVDLVGGAGPTSIKLVSGDVEADLAGGDTQVAVVSGDVKLRFGELSGLSVSAVSGDARVDAQGMSGKGAVSLSTLSGNIDLSLPAGANATFELKSGIGGEIVNRYSDDRPGDGTFSETLRFVSGDGNVSVTAKTMSGTVRLEKR